jgi:hypothetical protein
MKPEFPKRSRGLEIDAIHTCQRGATQIKLKKAIKA